MAAKETVLSSTLTEYVETQSIVFKVNHQETKDEDYDTDLSPDEEVKEEYDRTGRRNYQNVCRMCNITPVSHFVRHLPDDVINLAHHGIGPTETKALGLTLLTNTNILTLNLSDNTLGPEGAEYICKMMKENCYITELDVSQNKIGAAGAMLIFDMIEINTTLKALDISGNNIPDSIAMDFARALIENYVVEKLNVSRNRLGRRTMDEISTSMAFNDTIRDFNLSWNNFRQPEINKFISALTVVSHLKKLDLSFNGVGNEGGVALGNFLKVDMNIHTLILSNCRIFNIGCIFLAKGVEASTVLKVLKIDHNPIGIEGARALVEAISVDTSVLEHLDISGVDVDRNFIIAKEALIAKRHVTIAHAAILGSYTLKPKIALFGVTLTDINTKNIFNIIKTFSEDPNNANVVEAVIMSDKKKCGRVTREDLISNIGRYVELENRHLKYLDSMFLSMEDSDELIDIKCVIPPEPK